MNLNELRNAFPGEPESCHLALMQAALSVKEDEPVKKLALRTALIAALILAAMMAVAVAAVGGGLMTWFQRDYNAPLPDTAQAVLSVTETIALETEAVTFTVNELLCDGKIAYMTGEAQLKAEGSALLFPAHADPGDPIGEALAQKLHCDGVNAQTAYADAAKAAGLPLYSVNAWMELEDGSLIESEMMDGATLENGNPLLVRMLYLSETLPASASTLPMTLFVQVTQVDADTLEAVEGSPQRAEIACSIPVHGVIAQRSYAPEGAARLSDCFTLTGAEAKQTCAGVYVTLTAKTDAPMTLDAFYQMNLDWRLLDAQGNPFPIGISLTAEYLHGSGQPLGSADTVETLQVVQMIGVDALPERLIVTDGTANVCVK